MSHVFLFLVELNYKYPSTQGALSNYRLCRALAYTIVQIVLKSLNCI